MAFTRIFLAALFLFAGAMHLINPRLFLSIMPPRMPFPLACVLISGAGEILGGLGLLLPNPEIQRWAGWGLLLLLAAIFPANVYMAMERIQILGFPSRPWMGWARLPLQPVLMLAVSWSTHIWPR